MGFPVSGRNAFKGTSGFLLDEPLFHTYMSWKIDPDRTLAALNFISLQNSTTVFVCRLLLIDLTTTSRFRLNALRFLRRFSSDPNLPANQNVAKRTFKLNPDQIKLTLHYADNRITASSRTYGKDRSPTVLEVDPLAPRLDSAQLASEYQRMLAAERAAMQVGR